MTALLPFTFANRPKEKSDRVAGRKKASYASAIPGFRNQKEFLRRVWRRGRQTRRGEGGGCHVSGGGGLLA